MKDTFDIVDFHVADHSRDAGPTNFYLMLILENERHSSAYAVVSDVQDGVWNEHS
ncbi:MAG: hypothetical protein OEM85_03610 [Gammaproteobacteria bacterium]|nr:hypothetical protein [Gammaproteobacteria bacterium]MDH3372441.1 hypothetical protein [Gammaproteobacteria bacterium]